MAQWYVKEFSKLTGVSTQTLRYYDRVHLLKPSVRLLNRYRVYSEEDLLRLKRIIALKFFGFELSQIRALLEDKKGAFEHFSAQAELLEKRARALEETTRTLKKILLHMNVHQGPPWEKMIQYTGIMAEKLEADCAWEKETFYLEEPGNFTDFETPMKNNSALAQRSIFAKTWRCLIEETQKNLYQSPASSAGIQLAKKCITLINGISSTEYLPHSCSKNLPPPPEQEKKLEEAGLAPEGILWLEKAIGVYWRERICKILDEIQPTTSKALL